MAVASVVLRDVSSVAVVARRINQSTHTRLMMTQANPLRSASPLRQSKDNLVKQALDAHFSQPRPVEPPSDEEVRTLLSKVRLHLHTSGS